MRIRSIKPEFWRSDDVNDMSIEDRLLFIGLWSYVDDNGVGFDRVSNVAADLFAHDLSVSPHDTLMRVHGGLMRLHAGGQITRYAVGKKSFLHITNWEKHQKINRPSPGRYPLPSEGNLIEPEPFSEDSLRTHEDSLPGAGEQRSRGTEEQGNSLSTASAVEPESFEAFWTAYGKKGGRKPALEKYKSALKKPGVTPELLIRAAAEYIGWVKSENKWPDFAKDAATWLRGEHWNDERPVRTEQRSNVGDHLALVQQLQAEEQNNVRQIGEGR